MLAVRSRRRDHREWGVRVALRAPSSIRGEGMKQRDSVLFAAVLLVLGWSAALGACGGTTPVRTANGAEVIIDGSSMMLVEDGETVPIEVRFRLDSATLDESSLPVLDAVAEFIAARDVALLEVQGHADEQGGDTYNLELSTRRAEAVVAYLRDKGIDEERLRSRGFGAEQPVVTGDTPEDHRRNRRVEFILVDE